MLIIFTSVNFVVCGHPSNVKATHYETGDIVLLKSHPLTAAGYDIMAKFMPRYWGEYIIVGRLSDNVYFLKDTYDPNAPVLIVNVRQLLLIRKGQVESASEEEDNINPVSNLNLLASWKQERDYDPELIREVEKVLTGESEEFPIFSKELQPI